MAPIAVRAWQPGDLRWAVSSTLLPGDAKENSRSLLQFNSNEKRRASTRG
jgi:hypothetical protein